MTGNIFSRIQSDKFFSCGNPEAFFHLPRMNMQPEEPAACMAALPPSGRRIGLYF
jgi:hypothetical protein